jgi:DNA-directed RNA polymerase
LYPIQQHLNPQAPENIKPLIQFKEGQILDARGLYWLKIQGANVYGYDKLSFDDRIAKIDAMIDEIIEIANDPIGTMHIWDRADEPLQFLSFCFSLKNALQGKPVHTPVYLDASCSGIQIYSGLLLDPKGATATNVIGNGTDKPSDLYQEVADEVKSLIDAGEYPYHYSLKDGTTIKTHKAIQEIRKNISRKFTKKNVMTQPYSVTPKGMIMQNDSLLEEYIDANNKWWTEPDWLVARVMAELNGEGILRVVKGAKVGQKFLKDTLKSVLKNKDYILWYTPFFNFPVVQRIKKETMKRVATHYGTLAIYHETNETHYLRMLNGIAPNYVHSMDATLLYLTVEKGQKANRGNFMLIHDSFGVQPNNVDAFNADVRESYIELFSSKPLSKWYTDITNEQMPDGIMVGDLDLALVRDSKYIFS